MYVGIFAAAFSQHFLRFDGPATFTIIEQHMKAFVTNDNANTWSHEKTSQNTRKELTRVEKREAMVPASDVKRTIFTVKQIFVQF